MHLVDFSQLFARETTFVTSFFAFLQTKPLLKRHLLYKERIYSHVLDFFFPFGTDLLEGVKKILMELSPLKLYPFPIKTWF